MQTQKNRNQTVDSIEIERSENLSERFVKNKMRSLNFIGDRSFLSVSKESHLETNAKNLKQFKKPNLNETLIISWILINENSKIMQYEKKTQISNLVTLLKEFLSEAAIGGVL